MQCNHYCGNTRCSSAASLWLIQDDGRPNPGGWLCQLHATATIEEYRTKLGEVWRARPIDHVGCVV